MLLGIGARKTKSPNQAEKQGSGLFFGVGFAEFFGFVIYISTASVLTFPDCSVTLTESLPEASDASTEAIVRSVL